MAERYLRIGIQKDEPNAKLAGVSARFLQIGCGLPIDIPTGRRRFSMIEEPLPLKLGTEKNGGLAIELVDKTYHMVITGSETVENLSDDQKGKVTVVRDLEFARCQYRIGVSALAYGVKTLEELYELIKNGLKIPQTLEELKPGTRIATKHVNLMGRIIQQRDLNLEPVYYSTPEIAPEFGGVYWAADNFEFGNTWHTHNILESEEILLEPHAVLAKVKRLPWGMARIFNNEFLPRVDQALEYPERWLKSDMGEDSKNDESQKKGGPNKESWLRKLIPGSVRVTPEGVVTASTLSVSLLLALFTLPNPSGILNPWHSKTFREKDLRN